MSVSKCYMAQDEKRHDSRSPGRPFHNEPKLVVSPLQMPTDISFPHPDFAAVVRARHHARKSGQFPALPLPGPGIRSNRQRGKV